MDKSQAEKHPMRDISISVYERVEGHIHSTECENGAKAPTGPLFIAKYEPFHVHPIFFTGNTKEEVISNARKFADDAVEKYEATYLIRVANAKKAREARTTKKRG